MMKNILYAILTAVLLGGAVSCNVVDLDPNNKYDMAYAFKNMTNANLYLNSFYPMTANFGQFGSNALGGSNANMSDGLTDILKYGAVAAGAGDCNLIMTEDGRQSVSNNYFDSWTTCYGWIRRINEFLDGLQTYKGNFTEAQVQRLKAEALYYRAYAYFLIMRSHASVKDDLGVIPYTDINQMTPSGKKQKRATVAQSWNLIETDITFAANNLPEKSEAAGRLDRYAAHALRARAMLYAGRHALAKESVEEIMECPSFGYSDDYAAIFKSLGNKEVIWGYGYVSGLLTHNFDQKYSTPTDFCLTGESYGGGYAGPTQEFIDMYDYADGKPFSVADTDNRYITNDNASQRDPRLAASVLWNGAQWKGSVLQCYEGGLDQDNMPYGSSNNPGNTVTGYYMRKMLDDTNRDYVVNGSYQPWIEFRYAEMMLIYAECLAKEEKYTEAFNVVNDLRKVRFGKDDVYTAPINSWETALDVILKERAVELCFEGHRFWDLRRTGRARAVLDGKRYTGVLWKKSGENFVPTSVACDLSASSRKYPERFDRFPIPQSEITNNSEAKQNSDW